MMHDFITMQKRKDFPFTRRVIFEKRTLYLAYCTTATPIEFHVFDDGKLIIVGAYSAVGLPDGLYLDCTPEVERDSPVQTGNVLRATQAYSATRNGSVLEVT